MVALEICIYHPFKINTTSTSIVYKTFCFFTSLSPSLLWCYCYMYFISTQIYNYCFMQLLLSQIGGINNIKTHLYSTFYLYM